MILWRTRWEESKIGKNLFILEGLQCGIFAQSTLDELV